MSILGLVCAVALASGGPLRVLPSNPRYFTDGSGRAIYLAGSHNWMNFKDYGESDPPPAFDYEGYLDFMQAHHHNFFRLWSWELPKSLHGRNTVKWYKAPFPWLRTGPGTATDGKPKFDLSRFDQGYFDRMRKRVIAARDRGIYVAVMMWDGYGLQNNRGPDDGFPYDGANNINRIHCGGAEAQTLRCEAVTANQEAYARKVIETVNDLDNVLYEIANEAGIASTAWQFHMIKFIKAVEARMPKQHPVGMTAMLGGNDVILRESGADWISPSGSGYGYPADPPAADGFQVIINDTDHSFYWVGLKNRGLAAHREWVWKNFLRGANLAFMDPYLVPWKAGSDKISEIRNEPRDGKPDPYWETIRISMGRTRLYAEKMKLAAMLPRNDLASTKFCLANPGQEYLVYQPVPASPFTVNIQFGRYRLEWYDPDTGKETAEGIRNYGGNSVFEAPFKGDAVLYLKAVAPGGEQ